MTEVLGKISPLFALLLFGWLLQRVQYFEEVSYQRIQNIVLNIAIPCMLFNSFIHMDMHARYALVSLGYFGFMLLLLALGFLLYRLLHLRHRFFPFMLTSFGFGTLGLPLYITLFGEENAQYISILGVGHEFFIALVFLPLAQAYFSGEKFDVKQGLRSLLNPSLIMVGLALLIRSLGLNWLLTDNFIGIGIAGAIGSLGSLTLILTLIMVGYRLKLSDRSKLKTSAAYVLIRFAATAGIGTLYRIWVVDPLFGSPNILFDHAYNILLFQHGSIALTAFVGRYCPREDQEIINNVFVLNVLGGFLLYTLYAALAV